MSEHEENFDGFDSDFDDEEADYSGGHEKSETPIESNENSASSSQTNSRASSKVSEAPQNSDDSQESTNLAGIIEKRSDTLQPEKNKDDATFFTSNKSYISGTQNKSSSGQSRRNVQTQSNTVFTASPESPASMKAEIPAEKRQSVRKFHNSNSDKAENPNFDNSNDQMDLLKERAINLKPLDDLDNEQFSDLLIELNKDRKKQITSKNFQAGDRLNRAIDHVSKCQEMKQKLQLQQQEMKKFHEQKEEFEAELKRFDEETKEMIKAIEDKNNERLRGLEKQHEKEMNEHCIHWMSDAKVRQYNRASQKLMMNRKQLQLLLDQCRFSEAEAVQQIVNNIEIQEEIDAHKAMQRDYDESTKALQEKQESEAGFMIQKCKIRLMQVKQKREIERVTLMNKGRKIEALRDQVNDPEKVWNLAQNQRINEIYKKKEEPLGNKGGGVSRRGIGGNPSSANLPPIKQQSQAAPPLTSRQRKTSTIIKLPPLVMKRPTRRSKFAESAR